jgi:hypothetical protein
MTMLAYWEHEILKYRLGHQCIGKWDSMGRWNKQASARIHEYAGRERKVMVHPFSLLPDAPVYISLPFSLFLVSFSIEHANRSAKATTKSAFSPPVPDRPVGSFSSLPPSSKVYPPSPSCFLWLQAAPPHSPLNPLYPPYRSSHSALVALGTSS